MWCIYIYIILGVVDVVVVIVVVVLVLVDECDGMGWDDTNARNAP